MKSDSLKAYAMLITSMFIFGTIGIFRRYIPLSSAFLACTRGLIGSLCLFLFTLMTRGSRSKNTEQLSLGKRLLLVLSGGLIGVNWILLFEAYRFTTVPTATLCYYMEPTIVILLSAVFLRERLTVKKILCTAVALLGMVFVSGVMSGESLQKSEVSGILLGLGAALVYSTVVILNKRVDFGDSLHQTTVQLLSAALVLIPYLLLTEDFSIIRLDWLAVLMILILGVVHTGIAYALYFLSLSKLKAQSVAVLSYIDPVSALILASVILGEKMSVFGVIGAVLIIGSALVCELVIPKKSSI